MSVIITNMDIPPNCEECDFFEVYATSEGDEFTCERTWQFTYDYDVVESGRMSECPLMEIKKPHGRLIDADVLYNEISTNVNWEDCLYNAPTIIEQEE